MAGIVRLFNVLIYITWVGVIDSAPLNHTQPCQVNTSEVYFKDFDFKKFVGLWHTTWRSRSHVKGERLQTESRHFYMKEDDTVSIVRTKKTRNGGCSMYETTLTSFGNASYIQDSGEKFMMTIIETDYNSAGLLMYCTQNFQDGICADGDQYFEIISRDIQTVPEIEFALLSKVDELCSSFEDMVYLAAECQDGSVVVNTIPVLPIFDLQTKTGLSFAIAQSNSTTPNSLTGYNIYLSDIGRMVGWFTLETRKNKRRYLQTGKENWRYYEFGRYTYDVGDGSCTPVMSGMIKQLGKSGAHVYNRLGGLASGYPWYQWKVLYSDTNYTLAYFCYSEFNGTCPRKAEEVRLDGRVETIDPYLQKKLYVLLQKVCMSPKNMEDLVYKVDCASVMLDSINYITGEFLRTFFYRSIKSKYLQTHFSRPITEEIDKLKNNRCTLENLVISRFNRTFHQMDGIWYNVATMNSEPGHVFNITSNKENGLDIRMCKPIDNYCEWNSQMRLVQLCDEKAEFMQHVIGENITAQPTHLIRMAYIDEMSFFSYECLSESQGECDANNLVFRVYSRVPNLSKEAELELEDFLPFFCLNISKLQTSTNFPIAADNYTTNKIDFPELSKCAVENITPASDFNQTKILGYWYEIGRSGLEKSAFQNLASSPHSAVVYFAQNDLEQLTFNYFAALEDKCISNIFTGKTRPRCIEKVNGNYFARLNGKSWAFFKILYTDHENIIIMYACTYIYADGQCAFPLLHVLGKKNNNEGFKTIIDQVSAKSCINTVKWTIVDYKKNCTDFFISEQHKDEHSHVQPSDHHSVQNKSHQLTNLQPNNGNDTQMNLSSENSTDIFISEQHKDGHSHVQPSDHHSDQNKSHQLTNLQPNNGNDTQMSLSSENSTDIFISEQHKDGHSHHVQPSDHHSVQNKSHQLTNLQPNKGNDTQMSLSSENSTDFFISEQHKDGHSHVQPSDHHSVQNKSHHLTNLQLDDGNYTQMSLSSDDVVG